MELGPYTLQIFVSLLVILGAAFVALVCDVLKGNNEHLRELTLELKIRREEERKRYRMAAPSSMTPAMATAAPAPSASMAMPAATVAEQPDNRSRRTPSSAAIAAMERGEQLATMRKPKAADHQERPSGREERPSGRPERSAERAAAAASTASMVENMMASRAARKTEAPAAAPAVQPAPAAKVDSPPMDKTMATPAAAAPELKQQAPVPPAASQALPPIPAGFQDGFVLSSLVKSRQPVSGLIVSIGVNAPKDDNGQLPEPVKDVIRGLLGPEDFAAQTSADEFLLIMPKEHGADAQRRLSRIAQQLWDFQLRSLGKYSILFSWGGVEVERESIEEAIASASERMQETKRGRKILTMEPRNASPAALRKAV